VTLGDDERAERKMERAQRIMESRNDTAFLEAHLERCDATAVGPNCQNGTT